MTQDEIIEMARQVGFHISPIDSVLLPKLEAFAKLVAAKEREACARVCESYISKSPHSWGGTTMAAAIRARGQA